MDDEKEFSAFGGPLKGLQLPQGLVAAALRAWGKAPSGPADAADYSGPAQVLAALNCFGAALANHPGYPRGSIMPFFAGLPIPAGWVLLAGGTIGSAASGATALASADTAVLFADLWRNPHTRLASGPKGSSAEEYFAAGKALILADYSHVRELRPTDRNTGESFGVCFSGDCFMVRL